MRYLVYFIIILLLFSLTQIGFGSWLSVSALPSLLFLYTLVLAVQNEEGFYFFATLSGLYLDFSVNAYPGSFLFGFLVIIFLIRVVFSKLLFSERPARYMLIVVSLGTYFLAYWVFLYNQVFIWLRVDQVVPIALPRPGIVFVQMLLHLALLYPVYMLDQYIQKLLERLKHNRRLI